MELIEPSQEHLEAARALYNRAAARAPVGWPAQSEEFARWVTLRRERLSYERTRYLVAEGQLRGIVHWGIGGPEARPADWYTVDQGDGVISALFVEPGDRDAAEAMTRAAVEDLRSRGCPRIWAWEDEMGPPFYAGGFGQLLLSMTEVVQALTTARFRVCPVELHLCLSALPARSGKPPVRGLEVRSRVMPGGETSVDVWDAQGATVGQCVWASMALKSEHPDASQAGYVWWLGIEEAYRGMGAGRWLMELAMGQMARSGHTRCYLTTRADNLRAQSLYYSLGFGMLGASAMLCLES